MSEQLVMGIPAASMRPRHPLGLPAGSVRALIAILVIGTIWVLLLMPAAKVVYVPLYLYYLMFLIVGCYFAGRGPSQTAGEPPPLFLPRGTIRILLLVGTIGVLGFALYRNSSLLSTPLFDSRVDPADQPTLLVPIFILGGFILGVVVNQVARLTLMTPVGLPGWYQDTFAWVSVIAVLGLSGVVLYLLVINPSVTPEQRSHFPHWIEYSLSAIIAFYFGARS